MSSLKELKLNEQLAHKDLVSKLDTANEIYSHFYNCYSDVKCRADFCDVINRIDLDKDNHFVSLAAGSDGRISYARKVEDRFNPTKKIRTSFARYLRRNLKVSSVDIPDIDLEVFQEAFKLAIQSKKDLSDQIKILRGDDIINYYRDTLIKSCMTGVSKTKKIELYAINKDKVGLIVINNLARGLIWNCDDGTIFVDKLYGSNLGKSIIKEWSIKNGYKDSFDILYHEFLNLKVTLKMTKETGTPCLDTFYYGKLIYNKDEEIDGVIVSSNNYGNYNVRFSDLGLVHVQ